MDRKEKIHKVMHEFKHGELTSHGRPVTDRKQAIAIALNQANKEENKNKLKEFAKKIYNKLDIIDELRNW